MAKESSFQIFPIKWYVKEAYRVVKIAMNINIYINVNVNKCINVNIASCVKKTSLLIWNTFYHISYGKHCFVKLSQSTDAFGSWNSRARQFCYINNASLKSRQKTSF